MEQRHCYTEWLLSAAKDVCCRDRDWSEYPKWGRSAAQCGIRKCEPFRITADRNSRLWNSCACYFVSERRPIIPVVGAVLVITGATGVTSAPTSTLNTCWELPAMLVAVIVTGPKVPTDGGVPLSILSLRVSHEGLPLTEYVGAGVPVEVIE